MAVGVTAAAQEGERGVDLARHQQEDKDRAKAAAADRPLLQAHIAPACRTQAKQQRTQGGQRNDNERGAHVSGDLFTGSVT